ncbi:hypothetical protein QG37_04694 [Candidozyma auris]|nr:hypothetical protein QG37_04694 [[Candida] auris]
MNVHSLGFLIQISGIIVGIGRQYISPCRLSLLAFEPKEKRKNPIDREEI